MEKEKNLHCFYSDLPSPMAYAAIEEDSIIPAVLSDSDINRIIEMAWEDRTPFEAIKTQFGCSEKEVKALMKRELKLTSYTLWRKRVTARKTKHSKKRDPSTTRFKSTLQRTITSNKISKRTTK